MKNVRLTICLVAAVLFMAAGQGFGWTQYKDGGTHNINSTINDDVWVDYLAPGMQTTVNLLNGGTIPSPYKLQGYNDSRINISGGSVGFLFAHNNSHVTMTDGSMSGLQALNSSQVTMSGGSVAGHFFAYDSSQVTISGGFLNSNLYVNNSSQVTMSGGSVHGSLQATGSKLVNWLGGTIEQELILTDIATLTIDGSNFAIDGTPFGFGEITSIFGGSYDGDPFRRLTGTLANGDIINNQFRIGDSASIMLVPEPTTLLLLGLGAVILRRKRK